MTSANEIRLTSPRELSIALTEIGLALDSGRPAYALFAAEGTAAQIYLTPFEAFHATRESLVGKGAAQERFTLVTRIAWTKSAAWIGPCFHDVAWVREHLVENAVDAVPLAVFLNLLEITRGRQIMGPYPPAEASMRLMGIAEQWLEEIGRPRFDDVLPSRHGGRVGDPKPIGALFADELQRPRPSAGADPDRIGPIRHREL